MSVNIREEHYFVIFMYLMLMPDVSILLFSSDVKRDHFIKKAMKITKIKYHLVVEVRQIYLYTYFVLIHGAK